MSGPWLSSSRSRGARRGDHRGLSLPGPACLYSRFRPRTRGGARLKPTAPRDAAGSAELPARKRAARAMPPRVLVLALPGGHAAVWLSILPYSHAKLWPVLRTCLPPDDDDGPRPCLLGRFCEPRPLGRNLYPNPRGIGAEPRKGCPWDGLEAERRGSRKPLGLVRGLAGRPGTWAQTFFHLTDAFLPWRTVNCRSRREEESWEEERRLALEDSFWPFYRWTSLFPKGWGGWW